MTRTHPILPFLAAIAGICVFSLMDAVMKGAAIAAGVYSALVIRNALGSVMMLPIWLLSGAQRPGPAALRIHAIRSAVVAAMAVLFFWGLVRVLGGPRRWVRSLPLMVVLFFTLLAVVFWGALRMRVPVEPLISLHVALGLDDFRRRVRERRSGLRVGGA